LNASVVINPQTVLVSYDLVIPPSQSSQPWLHTVGMHSRPEKRAAAPGWAFLGLFVPIGLVGAVSLPKGAARKRWLRQVIILGVLLLTLLGLSGCFDIYGSMRASYSFPTSDSVRAYLTDPAAALPEWRFASGSGTIVLDLTVASEDEDGNRTQESCRTNLTVAGDAGVYPDGVLKNTEN